MLLVIAEHLQPDRSSLAVFVINGFTNIVRLAVTVAAIGAAMYAVCCAMLFGLQRSMIFTAQRGFADPTDVTFPFTVSGTRLIVSCRLNPGPNAVIYFGGNAENVASSVPTLQQAYPDASIYALHYRGYNGSAGTPSEAAFVADALALYDYVLASHPHIDMIGRSLGSGVAIHVASMRRLNRLVLVTPYNSLLEIAAQRFPLFPVRWLMLDKFESWRYAPLVASPTLILAAEYDEVIPRASTKLLYQHLPKSRTTLTIVPDAGHNTISQTSEYPRLLRGPP